MIKKYIAWRLAASLVAITICISHSRGLIIPDAEDSSTNPDGNLTQFSGKSSTLTVSAKQTALIQFNLSNQNIVPLAYWGNRITSARLIIFITDVESPGDLTLHAINSSWTEAVIKSTLPPAIDSTPFATIPAAQLVKNRSIVVNLPIDALYTYAQQFGIAIQTSSPHTKVKLVSKEDGLHGMAPVVDLEGNTNLSNYTDGNLIIGNSEGNAVVGGTGNNTMIGDNVSLYGGLGTDNTATGSNAMNANTTSTRTTAAGAFALCSSSNNQDSTVNGAYALYSCAQSRENTVMGSQALYSQLSGLKNTAVGAKALYYTTSGSNNIAIGDWAGSDLISGANNIYIGNVGAANDNNAIRIGTNDPAFPTVTNTYIAGIYGMTAASGVAVYVDSNGHLGTLTSSQKFKRDITPMGEASAAILSLKPVTFRYKESVDPAGIPQFGLVAEEVAKVDPDLVARDAKGGIYTVRYEAVNAMLLNEFLKEHQRVQELEANETTQTQKMAEQQREIRALSSRLTEVDALLKKVAREMDERQNGKPYVENAPGPATTH